MATKNSIDSASPIEVSKGGTGASTLTDHGILLGSGTGTITSLSSATDGQLVIGSTSADPTLATLVEGSGITITNASGSITIASATTGLSINTQTSDYTLVLTDNGKLVSMDDSDPLKVTVPLNSSVAFSIGAQILAYQKGAGTVGVCGVAGVTIRTSLGKSTKEQYSVIRLTKLENDVWVLDGDATLAGIIPSCWTTEITSSVSIKYLESDRISGFLNFGNSGVMKYSNTSDLTTWTAASTNPFDFSYEIYASYYYDGTWVAVAGAGQLGYSTDSGDTWTLVTSSFGTFDYIYGVGYGNGNWVAVGAGENGEIASSTSATSGWTQRTVSTSATLSNVAYGNGLWVTVGSAGTVITATDPTGTWTSRTSNITTYINSVYYGNGLWVAVAMSGDLITSPDGITWTVRTSSFSTDNINIVRYANNLWFAGADSGKLATSTDGITWTQMGSNVSSSSNIYGLGFANGYWVVNGDVELIESSYVLDKTPLSISNGGTNAITMDNTNGINYFDGTSIVTTAVGTATHVLTSNGTGVAPTFQAAATGTVTSVTGGTNINTSGTASDPVINFDGTLPVANGGTGATTLTSHGLLLGDTTSAVTATAELSDGQLLIGNTGNVPTLVTLTEGAGINITNAAGSITVNNLLTMNNQTGTSYTTVLSDVSKYITMTNASASTLTIPPNSSVAYPIGTTIYVQQLGAGQVTLTPDSGVTFRSADNAYKLAVQYSCASVVKILSDTWSVQGDVAV